MPIDLSWMHGKLMAGNFIWEGLQTVRGGTTPGI